jgi:spermidine synthase
MLWTTFITMDQAQNQFNPVADDQLYYLQKNDTRIEVLQNQHHIWLEINQVIQSAFSKDAPYRPAMPHSVVMLLPLIHDREPNSILELGGGGQSAQRYLAASHPDIHFLSIEYNLDIINTVIQVLPYPEPMNILHADAFSTLREFVKEDSKFDWLMVDLFHGAKSPEQAFSADFFADAFRVINDAGWLVFNCLEKREETLRLIKTRIEQAFSADVKIFRVPGMHNHIFMIKKGERFEFPIEIEQHNIRNSL